MKRYFKIWLQLAKNSFANFLSNRIDAASYLAGKLFRFGFFWLMIISIFQFTDNLAGYTKFELLLFFLTFNLIDVSTSIVFRGIYEFKNDIRRGNFDFAMVKPVNPLFMALTKIFDWLDLIFIVPIAVLLIYVIANLPQYLTLMNISLYIIFLALGFLIALGLHILSACITMLTIEGENFVWLYRDLLTFGRFPPEIYSPQIKFLLTYVMPIIVIVAFPAKAFLGRLDLISMVVAAIIAVAFFGGSLLLWNLSLKKYSSASS